MPQIHDWLLEGARAEGEREGRVRFHQFLSGQSQRAPPELAVIEAEVISPLRFQNREKIFFAASPARESGGNQHVKKSEHVCRGRAAFVREWIVATPRVMQAGGGLEPGIVLGATDQEPRNVACRRKCFLGDAARANLGAGIGGGDGGDMEPELVVDWSLDEKPHGRRELFGERRNSPPGGRGRAAHFHFCRVDHR